MGTIWRSLVQLRWDGRSEKRVTMAIPVCLRAAEKLPFIQQGVTANVSPHGARIIIGHRWTTNEQPELIFSSGKLRAQAKVVYCEPQADGKYCLGLHLLSAIADWE